MKRNFYCKPNNRTNNPCSDFFVIDSQNLSSTSFTKALKHQRLKVSNVTLDDQLGQHLRTLEICKFPNSFQPIRNMRSYRAICVCEKHHREFWYTLKTQSYCSSCVKFHLQESYIESQKAYIKNPLHRIFLFKSIYLCTIFQSSALNDKMQTPWLGLQRPYKLALFQLYLPTPYPCCRPTVYVLIPLYAHAWQTPLLTSNSSSVLPYTGRCWSLTIPTTSCSQCL